MSSKTRHKHLQIVTPEEELENLKNEVGVLHRAVESKSAAVGILRTELQECQKERDKFRTLAEQGGATTLLHRQTRTTTAHLLHHQHKTLTDPGRSAMLSGSDGTLAQLLCQAKEENRMLRQEATELRCRLHDAQADTKVLREEVQRWRGGGGGTDGRHRGSQGNTALTQLALQERERFISQMEELSVKCQALEGDVRGLVEEREELVRELDTTHHKLHRLNFILNTILNTHTNNTTTTTTTAATPNPTPPKRIIDLDGIITENRYLQQRLKQTEEEVTLAKSNSYKYKSALEKCRSQGSIKLGTSDNLIVTPKQVSEILQEYRGEVGALAESDLRSLCVALVDALSQRSRALRTQRSANKVLVGRVNELERRLTADCGRPGPSTQSSDEGAQRDLPPATQELMEGYTPPADRGGLGWVKEGDLSMDPRVLQLLSPLYPRDSGDGSDGEVKGDGNSGTEGTGTTTTKGRGDGEIEIGTTDTGKGAENVERMTKEDGTVFRNGTTNKGNGMENEEWEGRGNGSRERETTDLVNEEGKGRGDGTVRKGTTNINRIEKNENRNGKGDGMLNETEHEEHTLRGDVNEGTENTDLNGKENGGRKGSGRDVDGTRTQGGVVGEDPSSCGILNMNDIKTTGVRMKKNKGDVSDNETCIEMKHRYDDDVLTAVEMKNDTKTVAEVNNREDANNIKTRVGTKNRHDDDVITTVDLKNKTDSNDIKTVVELNNTEYANDTKTHLGTKNRDDTNYTNTETKKTENRNPNRPEKATRDLKKRGDANENETRDRETVNGHARTKKEKTNEEEDAEEQEKVPLLHQTNNLSDDIEEIVPIDQLDEYIRKINKNRRRMGERGTGRDSKGRNRRMNVGEKYSLVGNEEESDERDVDGPEGEEEEFCMKTEMRRRKDMENGNGTGMEGEGVVMNRDLGMEGNAKGQGKESIKESQSGVTEIEETLKPDQNGTLGDRRLENKAMKYKTQENMTSKYKQEGKMGVGEIEESLKPNQNEGKTQENTEAKYKTEHKMGVAEMLKNVLKLNHGGNSSKTKEHKAAKNEAEDKIGVAEIVEDANHGGNNCKTKEHRAAKNETGHKMGVTEIVENALKLNHEESNSESKRRKEAKNKPKDKTGVTEIKDLKVNHDNKEEEGEEEEDTETKRRKAAKNKTDDKMGVTEIEDLEANHYNQEEEGEEEEEDSIDLDLSDYDSDNDNLDLALEEWRNDCGGKKQEGASPARTKGEKDRFRLWRRDNKRGSDDLELPPALQSILNQAAATTTTTATSAASKDGKNSSGWK